MPRECAQCGREIPACLHKGRKTCSDRCRLRWRKRHNKRNRDYGEYLPIGPWCAWLETELARRRVSLTVFASQLGVSEGKLQGWLADRFTKVSLDVVDRALCEADEPMALRDIYPYLYDIEGAAA